MVKNQIHRLSKVCHSFQPDNLLASVLAHPILTASGLQGRDHRFIRPSTAASAAASVLASLSTSQFAHGSRGRPHGVLPSSLHPEATMYHSDRTAVDRYLGIARCILSFHFCSFYQLCNCVAVCPTVSPTFGATLCTRSLRLQRWVSMPSTCTRSVPHHKLFSRVTKTLAAKTLKN